jgi:hypothetical protein
MKYVLFIAFFVSLVASVGCKHTITIPTAHASSRTVKEAQVYAMKNPMLNSMMNYMNSSASAHDIDGVTHIRFHCADGSVAVRTRVDKKQYPQERVESLIVIDTEEIPNQ